MICLNSRARDINTSISGLVVEYIVAIDVTRVRFPADAYFIRAYVLRCVIIVDRGRAYIPPCRLNIQDTLPEWSKGVDSSSTSASCVGSNPTGVILAALRILPVGVEPTTYGS